MLQNKEENSDNKTNKTISLHSIYKILHTLLIVYTQFAVLQFDNKLKTEATYSNSIPKQMAFELEGIQLNEIRNPMCFYKEHFTVR